MATPTDYPLDYDDPCDVENNSCDDEYCGNKEAINARPQVFCRGISVLTNSSVSGDSSTGTLNVSSDFITVGGQVYKPTIIIDINNTPHLVLAVY